jgi:hypothetical protein
MVISSENLQFSAINAPEFNSAVTTSRGNDLTIGADTDRSDSLSMLTNSSPFFAIDTPELDSAV